MGLCIGALLFMTSNRNTVPAALHPAETSASCYGYPPPLLACSHDYGSVPVRYYEGIEDSPLKLPAETLLPCHSQYSSDELDRARTVVVGGDRVGDASGVDVRVADTDGRYLVPRRLPQRVLVERRAQEDQQTRLEARWPQLDLLPVVPRLRDLTPSKHLLRVTNCPRQPLGHSISILAQSLGVLPHCSLRPLETSDKDDDAIPLNNSPHDLCCASEVRERLAQVDVGDVGTGAVDEGNEGTIRVGGRMPEVRAGRDEVGEGEGGGSRGAVEGVMRLPGGLAGLGGSERAELVA